MTEVETIERIKRKLYHNKQLKKELSKKTQTWDEMVKEPKQ